MATLPRTFDYGFSCGLMAKDLAIAAATWALVRDVLGFDADYPKVITLIEKWSGFEVPPVAK